MNIAILESIFNCKIKRLYLDVFIQNPFSLLLRNDIVNPIVLYNDKALIIKKSKNTTYISNILLNEITSYEIIKENGCIQLVLKLNKIIYRMLVVK